MSKRIAICLLSFAAGLTMTVRAQEMPYKEGPVVDVTPIRVQDGKWFDYWHFLETHWKVEMEEAKKQGLVLSYSVYSAVPRTPQDANLILVVTYPSYATLDGLDDKMSVIEKRLFGNSPEKSDQEAGARTPIRTILGDEFLRELQFKK
jgi:hypothetical protein